MTRRELYDKINELQLKEVVKQTYGKNYTILTDPELEAVVSKYIDKEETEEPEEPQQTGVTTDIDCPIILAFVKLVSILRSNRVLSEEDAKDILSNL